MNRHAEKFHAQGSRPLTIRQRIFVAALLLCGLILSFVIVRYIDPTVSATSRLSLPELHLVVNPGVAAA
jgi:hypothetical protein